MNCSCVTLRYTVDMNYISYQCRNLESAPFSLLLGLVLVTLQGAGRSSEVERSLMVRWVVGSILHGVDPLYVVYQNQPLPEEDEEEKKSPKPPKTTTNNNNNNTHTHTHTHTQQQQQEQTKQQKEQTKQKQ